MLKATNLPVPRLAVNLAALRASMAKRPTAQSGNLYGPSGQPTSNAVNRRVVIG